MENTNISLRKRIIIVTVFIVFLLFLLLLSLFSKKSAPTKEITSTNPTPVPQKIDKNTSEPLPYSNIKTSAGAANNNLGTVSFNLIEKDIPDSGTIYTQAPSIIPADTITKIQSTLMPGAPEEVINTPKGQVISMNGNDKSLIIYIYSKMIVYTSPPTDNSTGLSQNDLIAKAQDFAKKLSLTSDLSDATVKYFTNKTGDIIETDSFNSADIVDVSFPELVKNLKVFRQFGSNANTHVWLSKGGSIIKLTHLYSPFYEPQTSIKLPTLKQAEDDISNNKGIIVGLGNDYQQGALSSPSSTLFNSITVGYFSDGENDLLYPIFVFQGTSTIKGENYPITVYLPIAD